MNVFMTIKINWDLIIMGVVNCDPDLMGVVNHFNYYWILVGVVSICWSLGTIVEWL